MSALALAKTLPQQVIASDINPLAVKTTQENVRLNNIADLFKMIEAQGLDKFE